MLTGTNTLGRNFVNGKLTECHLLFPAVRPFPKGNIDLIPDCADDCKPILVIVAPDSPVRTSLWGMVEVPSFERYNFASAFDDLEGLRNE